MLLPNLFNELYFFFYAKAFDGVMNFEILKF